MEFFEFAGINIEVLFFLFGLLDEVEERLFHFEGLLLLVLEVEDLEFVGGVEEEGVGEKGEGRGVGEVVLGGRGEMGHEGGVVEEGGGGSGGEEVAAVEDGEEAAAVVHEVGELFRVAVFGCF